MDDVFGVNEVCITEDEVLVTALCLHGVRREIYVMDDKGKFYYIFKKTPELRRVLEAYSQNTLTVKVQDFWSTYNQPGPDPNDFYRGK